MNLIAKQLELITNLENTKVGNDYTQIKRKLEDGVDYEVHVYGNPLSNYWGYQIIYHNGDLIKSEGFGAEAASRTFDWIKRTYPWL